METAQNIQKISFIFFAIFGGLYITSGLMLGNNYLPKIANIGHKILDLPVIFTGILYSFSSLRNTLATPEERHRILDTGLMIIGSILFITAIIINFMSPDVL